MRATSVHVTDISLSGWWKKPFCARVTKKQKEQSFDAQETKVVFELWETEEGSLVVQWETRNR
jgi:hypothetical protein